MKAGAATRSLVARFAGSFDRPGLNPLLSVRSSCLSVFEQAKHVTINVDAIEGFAESIVQERSSSSSEQITSVDWDASGWHYCADAAAHGPLTCQYIFVLDALNFCFWPTEGLEYDTLALALKAQLEQDASAFDAARLASITAQDLSAWFPLHVLPAAEERAIRLNELGQALLERFDGQAANMVKQANGSAVSLVSLLLQHVPGFRDTSIYRGSLVHLYKRAQILVGDVWAAYGRRRESGSSSSDSSSGSSSTASPYYFTDVDQLTMFADYRVPQLLRQEGIMEYSSSLSQTIDELGEIASGSEEEVEIRACTIIAVDCLCEALKRRGLDLLVLEVDWLLWQRGEATKEAIRPHHRTRTIYY